MTTYRFARWSEAMAHNLGRCLQPGCPMSKESLADRAAAVEAIPGRWVNMSDAEYSDRVAHVAGSAFCLRHSKLVLPPTAGPDDVPAAIPTWG